ncbi:InlB B-repeat-containing protein [Gardnerella piotii]|uniref:InlB B-repeat-containing protein n=1 Tax=Gardnerella piotii TaxID=2792977 RepID=UPI003970E11C
MDKAKDVASKVNSSSKQVKHKSAKNKGASSLKNVSSQNANNASGRIGVAAVALASTLSMLLPGATALAKTPLNADSFDSSYVKSAAKTSGKGAGKGNGDPNGLYNNGLLNTGATSELARRQMVGSAKEYLVKHADSNADSNASAAGVDNQEAAAGDSSEASNDAASETGNGDNDVDGDGAVASTNSSDDVSVESSSKQIKHTTEDQSATKDGSEVADNSATKTATKGKQNNSNVAKPKSKAVEKEQPAEVKPAETPASKTEPAKSEPADTDPAKTEVVNPTTAAKTADASNPEPANSEPAAKTDSSAKTETDQKSAKTTNTENAQSGSEQNASANLASTESAQPAAKAKNDSTTPKVRKPRSAENNGGDNSGSSVPSADAGSSADAGNTTNPSAEKPVAEKPSAKEPVAEGSANGAVTDRSGEGANSSSNDSNANSQVIKPNTDNQEAKTIEKANEQVQTDKKPTATYNLQIRYTIGGAPNKQLVQPYELTIDENQLNKLSDPKNYVYVKLPKSAGYNPAVYHSGNYQYYIEKSKGKYVIDDGMHADADRYLRLNKDLIKEYAVKKRQVVGGNSSDQTSQPGAKDGIQYYGELNINYAPKTAKYYIRHMLQDAVDRNTFNEDKNVSGVKTIMVGGEQIHVTEVTGTVGSNVSAVSVYIPGYEPEHNLISSPLSDSEDEKDKLVLNLRYYRKAYDVTYDSAGGTDVTAQKVYYDQQITPGTKPTKRGYTFKGWQIVDPASGDSAASTTSESSSTGSTSTKTVDFDKFKMPDHDVKLRAIWEKNKTTSYSVSVWVQKADLVDKEHPDSRANYDFVGLVERKNVKTGSSVDLNSMNDAGVANDSTRLSGVDENNPIDNSELGLTKEELQGKDADHKDGLIAKFNWMNDTPVTSLDGYNTENPGAESNYLKDSNGDYVKGPIDPNNRDLDNRVYKDLFTRYFKVNKKLTKRYTKDPNNTSTKLSANDLDNTFDLVYDRKEYDLIFAKPAGVGSGNNAAIKRKDENGKTTIYCYANGGDCSDKYDKVNESDHGAEINHNGYRVNVRYGQSLTDIWPDVDELDFNNGEGSLGWRIGFAGGVKYRDTPPYRFTKKEFADPRWRAVFEKNQKDKVAPSISDDPSNSNTQKYELKDNQRLLTADTNDQSNPIQVIIRKQSIASAKKGGTVSEDDYELSTDSYSKDDVDNPDYDYTAPSIAGFNPANGYNTARVGKALESDDFDTKLEEWYNESHAHGDWDDLSEDEQKAFAKKYHLAFRKYRGVSADEQENYEGDDVQEYNDNKPLEFRYDRQKYFVRFYNADGKAISAGTGSSDVAKEELPYEYSLSKRGKKDLTGDDKELYGKDTSYDASVVKDDLGNTSKQLDGKYTFTLNGKTYSIVRPDDLPKDYVFKGWAVDQTGRHLINGEINDNSEGAEGGSESGSKAKGEVKDYTVPVNGIKLYAAWGKPTDIKHTVTLDYDMPQLDDQGNVITNNDVTEQFTVEHRKKVNEQDLKVPTRKGYDFYGWELAKKGDEELNVHTPYAFSNQVVEDITLKAVWIEDTRYNGTFNHIFLKPGYTIKQYKTTTDAVAKAAMVDHISTQTVSGLREHLRYNAEAVYSDETHFPDKHFTSFEASKYEEQNTGEFIYQTYNTRKYKVRYVTIGEDGQEKDLLPESEVSSVNRKYDVAFYKPIEGFMPETTQQNIEYATDKDGKQTKEDTFTFVYKDVRVLKRKDDTQVRPTNYTRYVFKVAAGQSNMGSIVGYDSRPAGEGGLVYDVIGGTKAYQMPLPQDPIPSNGYEFAGWTSKIYIDNVSGGQTESDGFKRLPILSESQSNPKVVYTANFKLKAPVAIDTKVLKPTDALTLDEASAKNLIKNSNEYPNGATFSFADGATFDNTPGLHKIKVQVKLDGNTAETEVLYRVLPDLVYESEWDKFSQSDYGTRHVENNEYVKVTFTGDSKQGKILGHDGETSASKPSLFAYVYKGKKDISVRVPQAFGKEYEDDHYHYVFKGWTTSTETDPAKITNYDIKSEDRYKTETFSNDVTYHAVYKRIDYFSSSSDGGEVPKDAVVAIFKPAPGRLWKDGTSGPKVFYVKKGTDISKIPYSSSDSTNALVRLKENLTNATGTWKRSSMLNDGKKVTEVKDVAKTDDNWKDGWKVNESFQEFVADQTPWTEPDVKKDYFVAVQGDASTLPNLKDYVINFKALCDEAKIDANNVADVKVEYDLPQEEQEKFKQKMLDKPATYTIPLKITVNYKDGISAETYKSVGLLKVIHKLMYPESLPKLANGDIDFNSPEAKQVFNNNNFAKVNFINAGYDSSAPEGKGKFGEKDRTLYYALKNSATGVKAPQVTGKDYDANGYHYVFKGWRKLDKFVDPAANSTVHMRARRSLPDYSSIPLTTLFVNQPTSATSVNVSDTKKDLLTDEQIRNEMHDADTTYQAEYDKIPNVIDASTTKKTLEGYVPAVFLPEIGHRWKNGEYKPKLLYIRPSKEKTDNVKFMKKVADDTGKELYGFSKWRMFTAQGDKLDAATNDSWNISAPLMFVAEQTGVSDITIPETIVSAGDAIPDLDQLVNNTDPTNVKVEINHIYGQGVKPKDSKETDDRKRVYSPGTATVVVDVTRPTDVEGQTITTQIPIRVRVLPNVIADKDLPANDTKESKYIAQNYTKVTYVAGSGGEMKSQVHTYWVRKDRMSEINNYIPDVLANAGYVFKDWSSVTKNYSLDLNTNNSATSDQKEFLAKRAELAGLSFIAKKIRASERSSFATLKNLLDLGGKENGITISLEETTITANFELMKPMRFEFRSSAISGIPATFTLANLTENSSGNTTVKVDNTNFTINNFISDGGSNGLLPSCTGTTCKISGTPKIVDGKPKVEVKFTTVDQYGRRAEIVVYIDVVDSAKPDPTPTPTPTPEPDYSTVPSDYVVPAPETAPMPKHAPLQDKQKSGVKSDLLPQTGVDASQSALIASLLASVGFAGFAAKHRRKREDGKNN